MLKLHPKAKVVPPRIAPQSAQDAYREIVRIVQSYHEDVPLPLVGTKIERGKVVLGRKCVCTDACPVAVMRIQGHPAYPLHRHDFTEISIVLHGAGKNVVDGKTFVMKAGDVFVIQGRHEHAIREPEFLDILNICFDPTLLGISAGDFPDSPGFRSLFEIDPALRKRGDFRQHLELSPERLARVVALSSELDIELQKQRPGCIAVARAQLLVIMALLSRWYVGGGIEMAKDTRRVAKAILWMEQNLEEEFSFEVLWKLCGLSRRQFFRLFKQCTGQTPAEYFLYLRLRKAESLLRDPANNVTEAAFACGFKDSNHFSRSFKALFGFAPSEYRTSHAVPGGYSPSKTRKPS